MAILKKIILVSVVALLTFSVFAFMPKPVYASPKSLYVIADIAATPIPIQTYDIQAAPTYLAYQTTQHVPDWGGGAVGISIDSQSQTLFITYEISNIIQLINATTFANLGTTTAPGASNLAGIVYDRDPQKVYTVDRNTDDLYIYSWDATTLTLTLDSQIDMPSVTYAQGLALDEVNNLLYVGDKVATDNINVFSTGDWSLAASYTVSQPVQGIAVDVSNGIIYTGHAGWPPSTSLHLLCKLDMSTNIETTLDIRTLTTSVSDDAVVGLAVDQDTSLLYITTGNQGSEGRIYDDTDQIMVFDSDLNLLHSTGDIGNPTGLCIPVEEVSYNPLGLDKDDGIPVGGFVPPGGSITYTISFDNTLNAYDVHNVIIVDYLPPETEFVSASDGGTYDSGAHTVTWGIGTLLAGAPTDSVTLSVTVKSDTPSGTTIDNSVTIDSDQTPQTTQHEYTDVFSPTVVIPEVPFGTIMASVAMIIALIGYITIPRFGKRHVNP